MFHLRMNHPNRPGLWYVQGTGLVQFRRPEQLSRAIQGLKEHQVTFQDGVDQRVLRLNRTDREFSIRKMYQELRRPTGAHYIRDARVAPEDNAEERLRELGDPRLEWNRSSMVWTLAYDEETADTTLQREARRETY